MNQVGQSIEDPFPTVESHAIPSSFEGERGTVHI